MLPLALALSLAAPPDVIPLPRVGGETERRPLEEAEYETALIAAAHLFAEKGETRHLHAILDKHPKWVDQKLKFDGRTKPRGDEGYTLLRRAIEHDRRNTVELLIKLKADVKADCGDGWTPLHLAVGKGNLNVVELLVNAGADINAKTTALPERRIVPPSGPGIGDDSFMARAIPSYTVLDMAIAGKRDDVVKYLKEKGAKASESKK